MTRGLVRQAIAGETACGDHHVVIEQDGFVLAAVADGLGHGEHAEAASRKAIAHILAHPDQHPLQLLEGCHHALRGTRGAALAIVRIDLAAHVLVHAALGNVEVRIVAAERIRHLVSLGGIVGAHARKLRSEEFPFEPGDLLVMHTDGISDRMKLVPAMRQRDPQALAFQLAHEYGKHHDDQLLLLLKA